MKKHYEGVKLPSFYNKENQRPSRQSSFGDDITNLQPKYSSHEDIAKKIRNKIRVRKMANQQRNSKDLSEYSKTAGRISIGKLQINFEDNLNELWEKNEQITVLLSKYASIPPQEIQEKVIKEVRQLHCQFMLKNIEELLVSKAKRLCKLMTSEQRYEQHEKLLSRKFQQRMHKLYALQKII